MLWFISSAFHEVSVYPKKELPFFILFTAGLCSFTALLALLTHQYPEPMGQVVRTMLGWLYLPLSYILEKLEAILPSNLLHQLSRIWLATGPFPTMPTSIPNTHRSIMGPASQHHDTHQALKSLICDSHPHICQHHHIVTALMTHQLVLLML